MFNNTTSVFGRNGPVTRREASPLPAAPNPDRSAVSARNTGEPVVSGAASTNSVGKAPSVQPEGMVSPPSPTEPVVSKEPSANETVMGARLIVGPDVKLRGAEILDCDTLVVEGRVEATMDSRVIRIAENGSFCGKVSIDIAEIHGTFEGELTARSQLTIHSTGRVSGTIRYGKLVADEGGVLCGDVNVISENESPKLRPVIEPSPFLARPPVEQATNGGIS